MTDPEETRDPATISAEARAHTEAHNLAATRIQLLKALRAARDAGIEPELFALLDSKGEHWCLEENAMEWEESDLFEMLYGAEGDQMPTETSPAP